MYCRLRVRLFSNLEFKTKSTVYSMNRTLKTDMYVSINGKIETYRALYFSRLKYKPVTFSELLSPNISTIMPDPFRPWSSIAVVYTATAQKNAGKHELWSNFRQHGDCWWNVALYPLQIWCLNLFHWNVSTASSTYSSLSSVNILDFFKCLLLAVQTCFPQVGITRGFFFSILLKGHVLLCCYLVVTSLLILFPATIPAFKHNTLSWIQGSSTRLQPSTYSHVISVTAVERRDIHLGRRGAAVFFICSYVAISAAWDFSPRAVADNFVGKPRSLNFHSVWLWHHSWNNHCVPSLQCCYSAFCLLHANLDVHFSYKFHVVEEEHGAWHWIGDFLVLKLVKSSCFAPPQISVSVFLVDFSLHVAWWIIFTNKSASVVPFPSPSLQIYGR